MADKDQGAEPPRGVPWDGRDAVVVFLVIAVAAFLVIQAAVAVGQGFDLGERGRLLRDLLANIVIEALAVLVVLSYVVGRYHASIRSLGFRDLQARELLWPVAFVILAYGIILAYLLAVEALGLSELQPEQQIPSDVFDYTATAVVAGIAIVVVAPVAEETAFRGFLFAGLIRPLGVAGAALVAGVAFGVAHFQPGLFIPFSLVGMLFGGIYYWTKSLWVTILSHFLFNAVGFGVMLSGTVVLT